MDAAFRRQLEPFGFAAAIHTKRARGRVAVIAFGAVTAQQFAFRQPMKKGRVLFVAMDVIHLEMRPDDQRIN